eukprot:TRINITY_DN385_c0_g2_i1.p2 TRINITY_DN385_c0_g2~~TRINITY_DN385_c0_g2_i1.p2  ORF type:complete len:432 (-),score=110.11 TRINITY_DN385_c0_g2_i1:144-1370(-)
MALLLLSLAAVTHAQDRYNVGVGIVDASPTPEQLASGEVYLGGYGVWKVRGPAQGIHDPTWARAWVIDDGNSSAAFVTHDVVGTSNRVLRDIRARAAAATGIPAANIMISSTHTHSGPDMQGLWGGVPADYNATFVDKTVEAIVQAWEARQPAFVYASMGNGSIHGRNRRGWGYIDGDLAVLDFISAESGQRIGTVINFGTHPVKLGIENMLVAGDWCHYTRERAEELLRAPVLFFQGAEGDVNPNGCDGVDGFEGCEVCGAKIAESAVEFMAARTLVTGPLSFHTEDFRHVVTNPGFIAAQLVGMIDYDFFQDDQGDWYVDTQLSHFRLGSQVQGLSWPGECLTRIAVPLKEAMTAPYRFFFGLSGDALGYFIPSDEWDVANYEEKVSINKWVGDFTRDLALVLMDD